MSRPIRSAERGAILILVIVVVAILAAVSGALIGYAGQDRIQSAKTAQEARSLSCAEAGVQFGRRWFGCRYKTSDNWNAFLAGPGNRTVMTGNMDGTTPGTDFEVSVQDDEDEAPEGLAEDRARDNNLTLLLRSRCINPQFASVSADRRWGEAIEVRLVYLPSLSEHGSAPSGSNAMEAAAGGDWVRANVNDCP